MSMMMLYGLLMGIMVVLGAMYLVIVGAGKGHQWRSLGVILQTAQASVIGYMMMSQFLVGNVVLYLRCNDLNGEKLPLEMDHLLLLLPPTMSSASTKNRSLWIEVVESRMSIFKANSGHFHTLSILFLLPIFFSLVVYPSFHLALFHPDYDFITQPQFSHFFLSSFEIVVPVAYTLFLVLPFLCAVATITHSTVQASCGKPINLVSSIKSIRYSFFPLLSTFIVSQTIFISITLIFALVLVFLVQVLQTLGLKYDSNHFLFLVIPVVIVLLPVLIWLQVNWSLAYVIAVVESKWGFETLRRSAYLLKGKRSVAMSMMMLYGLLMGIMVVLGAMYLVIVGAGKGHQWRSLGVILQTAQASVIGYMMMSQFLVGNVVLYLRCNDLNGEKLPLEIDHLLLHQSLANDHPPPMSSASSKNRNLWTEVVESRMSIFKANSGHFHALSILFLLPISFSLVVYPSFHLALFHPDYDFISFAQPHLFLSNFEIIVPTMYSLFLVLLFLCAVATTTYSAVHASYGRPINLVSSIKSIRKSFFPLLSTLVISQTIFISITLFFALILTIVVQIFQALELIELKYDSNHFLFWVVPALIVLVPVLLWLQVNWSLAYVIAVVETKWGYETLRKSAYLVKGQRWVAFGIHLYYGFSMEMLMVCGSMFIVIVGAAKGNQWMSLGVILQTMLVSVMGYIMMNQYLVANVVLYMKYKDLNCEKLHSETGGEFVAGKYVSLSLDEQKNHVTA
uniref:Uncharacterized protein n=1 Tax=Nicotiana tabacum TaxID=4097 RepID=A0A1S3X6S8_TOBAC|nr:PREDICTED: uncharacterized protein LOC107761799 [Nicotiana tabacum]